MCIVHHVVYRLAARQTLMTQGYTDSAHVALLGECVDFGSCAVRAAGKA